MAEIDNNEEYFPWDETPETDLFPFMDGLFNVESMEDTYSNNTGKRMFKIVFTCQAPVKFKGMRYTKYYTVGTDELPDKVNHDTFGMRGIQQLRIACNIGKDVRGIKQFVAFMDTTNPPVGLRLLYKDRGDEPENDVAKGGYWKAGSREPSVLQRKSYSKNSNARKPAPGAYKKTAAPVQEAVTNAKRPPKKSAPSSQGPADMPPADDTPPVESYEAAKKDTDNETEKSEGEGFKIDCPACGEKVAPEDYSQHLANCKGSKA